MNKQEAKKRIEKLKKELNYHRHLYHVLDQPKISDAAWDSLKNELKDLENQYPEFITSDSPTQRVGDDPLKKFGKVKHIEPILSIEDVFEFQELADWEKYIKDYLSRQVELDARLDLAKKSDQNFEYFCERKVDGVDIVLTYQKGILIKGVTRGNGLIGENVTQNVRAIQAIPLSLNKPVDIVVRGEIFMNQKDFKNLNQKRADNNLPLYANPRNVAAGSVRQLDSKITAERRLDCYIFEIITDVGQKTHQETHQVLNDLGFKTDPETEKCENLSAVKEYYQKHLKKRIVNPFDYDGVVVLLNRIDLQKKMGAIGKSPRWMRAYKFPGEQATTIVEDILIQIGRTGALTPVAKLKPTLLMGSVISRATLHNQDEINRLDVRIGDTVIIEKAGDVIPAVMEVLKSFRTGREKKFHFPKICPFCQGQVVRRPNEAAHYCLNKKCFAIQEQKIIHFVSKKGFDIEGFGKKIVKQLMNNGLIKTPADIFTLTKGDLEPLERFAEKSAGNLTKAIEKSKDIELSHFIQALGIRHVGEQMAIDLAKYFKTLEKLSQASQEFLISLPNVGSVASQSIFNWFQNRSHQELLEKFNKRGVKLKKVFKSPDEQILKRKTIVFTGTMFSISREKAKEKVIALGGRVLSQISKQVDYLVAGENPGSKYEKAKQLGVKIINEKSFLNLLTSK